MGFLIFILSDFYRWAGLVILIFVIGNGVTEIVRAARKGRRFDIHQSEGFWSVTVENPPPGEVDKILSKLSLRKMEEQKIEDKQSK